MVYDLTTRTFIVETFCAKLNYASVQSAYCIKYQTRKPPNKKTIKRMVQCFRETGSAETRARKPYGPSKKRVDAKNQLTTMVTDFASLSIRKAASALPVSESTTRKIMREDLKLKPYKQQHCQVLKSPDFDKRLFFAQWLLSLPKQTKFCTYFTDEAYFHLQQPVNKQNNRIWSTEKPLEFTEMTKYPSKLSVWCAISAEGIIGPYFFESTVNQHTYLAMLESFFWIWHKRKPDNKKFYFQQDGASAHTAGMVQDWLKVKFGNRFFTKDFWPPRSPDLNPCDYFLWGYLKSLVYVPFPKTLNDLKQNIEREVRKISPDLLKSVFVNLEKRCELVISANGGHFEDK